MRIQIEKDSICEHLIFERNGKERPGFSTKKKSKEDYLQFLKEYEEMKQSHLPQALKKIKEDSLDELVQVPKETLRHIINFVHNLKAKDVSEIVSEKH